MGEVPLITVLMPVHNGEAYLREAVESILAQTFSNFELLIIDDGSTDGSVAITASFADPRIRLIRNETNLGVARTLNRGIDLACGKYVARMDADDISLPCRFEKQLHFLEKHPETGVVAAKVVLIDAVGREDGYWEVDRATTTYGQICRQLPISNCIAHPTVMMRKSIVARYRYRESQRHTEDYDLWLRLVADNVKIEKIDDYLLKYRVHANSVTAVSNAAAYGLKNILAKARYLRHRLSSRGRPSRFDLRVTGCLVRESVRFSAAMFEQALRVAARRFLVMTGRLGSLFALGRTESSLYFFFPYYHVGGAERVHADIVAAMTEERPWVIITHASKNTAFRWSFHKNGCLREMATLLENVITKHICLGYLSALINRGVRPCVFGSNTPFFYELLPYLDSHVVCIDLIHAFGGGLEDVSLPFVPRLDRRVVVTERTRGEVSEQYAAHRYSNEYLERVTVIENAVQVPGEYCRTSRDNELRILYVGRGSEEKRVHLVGEVARCCRGRQLPARFTLVGDVSASIWPQHVDFCTLAGEIVDFAELKRFYLESDILLVTSSREGFPMAVMEGMAYGVVPVCTDVGGISTHITQGVNGLLVPNADDETAIVQAFVESIDMIAKNRQLLECMAEHAFHYAAERFGFERFNRSYRELLAVGERREKG